MKYTRVLHEFYSTPWAILPEKLAVMAAFVRQQAAGHKFDAEEVQARIGAARDTRVAPASGAVAVIPVYGVISQRMNLFQDISGGTSADLLARDIRAAANDPEVSAILLDVDSPGGSVYGIAELGGVIYQARQQKPVVAIANSLMASAAYWLGSQASEVVVTPGGEAGSIGVITAHEDYSPLIEDRQLPAVELIYAGQYKAEGNPYQPLDDEARAAVQARVDEYYAMFVDAVARGRDVPAQAVREGFGQGRVLGAQAAIDAGLADRVATFDQVLGELVQSGGSQEAGMNRRRKRALAARREIEAHAC